MASTGIPLGIQQPKFDSSSDVLQHGLTMANLATATQLNQARLAEEKAKVQQAEEDRQDQQVIQQEFLNPAHLKPDKEDPTHRVMDFDSLRGALSGKVRLRSLKQLDADHLQEARAYQQKVAGDKSNQLMSLQLDDAHNKAIGQEIQGLEQLKDSDKPAFYAGAMQRLKAKGIDVTGLPPTIPGDGSFNEQLAAYGAAHAYKGMIVNDAKRQALTAQSEAVAKRAESEAAAKDAKTQHEIRAAQGEEASAYYLANAPKTPEDHYRVTDEIAARFPAVADVYSSVKWNPEKPGEAAARIQDLALSADQRAKSASRDAASVANTEVELARDSVDPKKSPEEREAANAALKRLDQSKLASRPVNNNSFVMPGLPTGGKPDANANLSGDDYLSTLPKGTANQIRAMMEGRTAAPSPQSRTQSAQQLRAALFQADPEWSEQRAQVRKSFTTGPDAKNIGALNTATVHLDQLGEAAKALNNGTFRPGNEVYNAIKTMFGGSAPTNFIALKSAVAGEMANALKGSATDIEIKNVGEAISSASSPKQLADVINTNLHTLGAKLNTYQERYSQQLPNDKVYSPILPSAKSVYDKHGISPTGKPSASTNDHSTDGYKVGHVYGGLEYLGGDVNDQSNWRKH